MKKLMLLGGTNYLIPVIKTAKKLGLYVITCDYLPNNDAHKFSDEYINVSVIDKDEVLKAAKRLNIDGIISFACDAGVVSAAYVAEKMNLPFQCSYESAKILQDKGLFRKFLFDNKFNCPHAKRYDNCEDALNDVDFFNWPVIVKPVDSAGSKCVTKVENIKNLKNAIDIAINGSHNGAFIIEDFLTFEGFHSSADLFTIDGELKFVTYSDQLFDSKADNPFTPAYIIWPTTMKQNCQDELTAEIQRLMKLLGMKTGIYNIETCVGKDGKAYIMEISPRGGGCRIAELQKLAFGIDLIENEIRKAVGLPVENVFQTKCNGHWCEMIVHGQGEYGVLNEIVIDKKIKELYLKICELSVKKGDLVKPFTGANMTLGDMILRFDSRKELEDIVFKYEDWLKIDVN